MLQWGEHAAAMAAIAGRAWAMVSWMVIACGGTGKAAPTCPDPSQVVAGVACVDPGLACSSAPPAQAPSDCFGPRSTCTCKQGQWECEVECSDAGVCAPGLSCAPGDACISLDPATFGETLTCDASGHYAAARDAAVD
jgi:hypothetical protein